MYGKLSELPSKIRTKQHQMEIKRIKQKASCKDHETGPKPCEFCEKTSLLEMRFPIEKLNSLFMAEFLHLKYNRPEHLILEDDPAERKVKQAQQAMRDFATELETRELINRKVIKLRTDLIYGPEKRSDTSYENAPLDFNYYDNISV